MQVHNVYIYVYRRECVCMCMCVWVNVYKYNTILITKGATCYFSLYFPTKQRNKKVRKKKERKK